MTDSAANPRVVLENNHMRVAFLPAHGGKISSLFDKKHAHEWLWCNPQLSLRPPQYGESYVKGLDFGGWDEIFPSVDPCRIAMDESEMDIPDHGDLVQLPWSIRQEGHSVEMSVRGRCCNFQFTRRVELEGPELRFSYRVENLNGVTFPWLWCAHPLVSFNKGLTVETDAQFLVVYASGAAETLNKKWIIWNDLPPRTEPWAAKLFSEKGKTSGIRLRHDSGAALAFAWDAQEIPYLGLWANHGNWSGCGCAPYFNLGVEPAFLPVDNLREAVEPRHLHPYASCKWSLCLRVNL